MSNKIKNEMDKIQIPSGLHERSRMGVEQAFQERKDNKRFQGKRFGNRKMLAVALLGIFFLSSAFFHTEVLAAVKKALQYIPGVGMVQEEDSKERYILQKPVTTQIGDGTLTITGMMVDEEMTFITVSAKNVSRFSHVKAVNEEKERFKVKSSGMSWSPNQWTSSYWHDGHIDLKGDIKLIFNSEIIIPVTLEKAKTYESYDDMGEIATKNGVQIIAIPQRVGNKVQISLVSEHPEEYWISDYGVNGVHMREEHKLNITDENNTQYDIEEIQGISAPADEFFFSLSNKANETYTITIPEIDVEFHDEGKIKLDIPENESHPDQTFELAGFPVKITKIKRLSESRIGLYVDVNLDETAPKSLYNFHIKDMGHMAKVNEVTGELEYLEFTLEKPNSKRVKLGFDRPRVIIRGPWTIEIPAEKYLLNID